MTRSSQSLRIPTNAVVVLIGPSSSGKSTWAQRSFAPEQIVSSDDLRGVVGESRYDLAASDDAFELLDRIVRARVGRGLLTVVDTLGLDPGARQSVLALATDGTMTTVAVRVNAPAATIRARNADRPVRLPARTLTAQITAAEAIDHGILKREGFDQVFDVSGDAEPDAISEPDETPELDESPELDAPAGPFVRGDLVHGRGDLVRPVTIVSTSVPTATRSTDPERAPNTTSALRFGLQIGRFDGDRETHGERLVATAAAAEQAGFSSLWVMDHLLQIPQVGRRWDDMLESYTTLSYLAAATRTIRLGVLVTAITFRRIPHLAKILATLDVLSGGRAICGLGAAWFDQDHAVLGTPLPPVSERYDLLRDACEVLPLLWGPGTPPFEGRTLSLPQAICYPRPLQDPIPILIGGSGERSTLRLVAEHADACNLFGDPARVADLVLALHDHCADVGRDPAEIEVTNLATLLTAPDPATLDRRLAELTPPRRSVQRTIEQFSAAPLPAQIDRFAAYADAGVGHAILTMPVTHPQRVAELAPLIEAFR